ncbi:uncharacterized protein tsr isoform X2 [Battus philenor]|uniref:uncharacterized protein tsr isoform X2 n=1 Tax=Battus philenor TaxID=42288 RepID=UPI0035D04639
MSLNPLNELKRRLEDENTPLPKRLRLAKNVIHSTHFPAAPKERIVAEWLENITENNGLSSKDIRDVISWLQYAEDLTNDLKYRLIKVITQYLHSNPPNNIDIRFIVKFLENDKIMATLINQVDDYLFITTTLLQNLRNDNYFKRKNIFIQKIFLHIVKYYKECKKKLDFIIKLLDGENMETLFSYIDTEHRSIILNVCQNILFPITRKPFFISCLQNLIWKDNIDGLIAEKGDNIQSVIKILGAFFFFPKGRTAKDPKFLSDFIDVFVSCYHNESQIIFAFYIIACSSLNIVQNYFIPEMKMPAIVFEENIDKIKRNIFLKMLNVLLDNEVDISVKLNNTLGEKVTKIEIKKNFMTLLQVTMLGLLKLEGKPDKSTIQIIKAAMKLDPSIIEQKLEIILPFVMTSKKSSNVTEAYTDMLNCLIETFFKLSRGPLFINQILTYLKLKLETMNIEQFELKQTLKDSTDLDNSNKIKNKIITGIDIIPQECVETYGRCTSELMFRQNAGLLTSLQKDLEENCLMMLEEGFVSPSIITLTEILTAILSSFFRYSKMADHTVPQQIAEEFWSAFEIFQEECLQKFGECILKLNYNAPLLLSFLKLCLSYSQLKLLNLKYGNIKMKKMDIVTTERLDCSVILPCLNVDQWSTIAQMIQDDEAVLIWDNLLLIKTMAIELINIETEICQTEAVTSLRTHLIKELATNSDEISSNTYFTRQLFTKLDTNQAKQLAKALVKAYINGVDCEIFQNEAIAQNRILLNALVLETTRNIMKCFKNGNTLSKPMNKTNFDIVSFVKSINVRQLFNELTLNIENEIDNITKYVQLLRLLQIFNLTESYQLTAIFVLLAVKKCCHKKKLRRSIDSTLQVIFELSPKCPDIYKIFPVDYIFSFEDNLVLNLLTLSIKTTNQQSIVKNVLEVAVKKVKINSEIVKEIVEILLSKNKSSEKKSFENIEYFSDTIFQLQCTILPIIAKEKRAVTLSAYRTIFANLQERLHQAMLESFMRVDFTNVNNFINNNGNTDDNSVSLEMREAIHNAIGAYSLTLLKYCEVTDVEEIKKLDCLWSGFEFFVQNAIKAIESPETKIQHVDSSIQLLNIILRYIKRLETHRIFQDKDAIFKKIWQSVKTRVLMLFNENSKIRLNNLLLEGISVTLKFLAELSSVECFVTQFMGDIDTMLILKKPAVILKNEELSNSELTSHRTCKYLLQHCLKANIIAPKCIGIKKLTYRVCDKIKYWIQEHFEDSFDDFGGKRIRRNKHVQQIENSNDVQLTVVTVDDAICKLLRYDLDMIAEVVLAAKKIPLDYRFLDAIFELQHLLHYILGRNSIDTKCNISWQAFFDLNEGCMILLNNLLMAREQLLEDRWPCYTQCYKTLIYCLCERVKSLEQIDRPTEQKLAEAAHSIEKLTQSICKRKAHVSRIAAYAIGDICTWIEKTAPPKMVRQHLENSIALLIQVSDSTYAMAFLRRALAGSIGQMTMTNMYSINAPNGNIIPSWEASGVTVSDACKTTYEEIKKDKKHRYVVFYIRDEKQIDVETIGERNAEYDQFLEDLQKGGTGECRYGLFDFEYTHQCQGTSEASKKQKLFLMSWCPDTAKVKKKMLYSSSFDALKKSLVGVQKCIQATDLSEASQEAVEEKLRATDRQ